MHQLQGSISLLLVCKLGTILSDKYKLCTYKVGSWAGHAETQVAVYYVVGELYGSLKVVAEQRAFVGNEWSVSCLYTQRGHVIRHGQLGEQWVASALYRRSDKSVRVLG